MQEIYFATGNPNKAREAEAILGVNVQFADIEFEEVQSMDLDHVTRKKAEEAYRILQKPVLVDDVGFEVEAWNGFPGPLVKYLFSSMGNEGFLRMMEHETNRSVKVQSMIGYHDGNVVHTFLGEFTGTVTSEERGNDGWGFDPVIIPEGEELTLAELGFDHKNHNSHRAISLQKLKEFLDSQEAQNKL